jgi:putative flippase GtrA
MLRQRANVPDPRTLALSPSPDSTLRKLVAFGVVGLIGTGAHYATLILLVEVVGLGAVAATTAGFAVGALVNYLLNYRFTFKSGKAHLEAGPKFFLVALVTGLLNSLLVALGVEVLGVHYLPVQIVATLIVFLANFALNSLWTFRESSLT